MRTAHVEIDSFCSKYRLSVQPGNDSFRQVYKSVAFLCIFRSSSISVVQMDLVHIHLPGFGFHCNFNVHIIKMVAS